MKRLLTFILIVAILGLFISCSHRSRPDEAGLNEGTITLTSSMLEEHPIMSLTGEAGFYWGRLIDPSDPPPIAELTEISEDWGGSYPEQGDASIRFIIKKDPLVDRISLSYGSVWSSYRLYINGFLVAQSGSPSTTAGRRQLFVDRARVVHFDGEGDTLDVVFHISNPYYHRNGVKQLKVGLPEEIDGASHRKLLGESLVLGILLAMTLYHFVIAASRTNKTYILLSAFLTLTITYRYFFIGSKLVFDLIPGLNMNSYDRLQRLGIYPVAGFFISYLAQLYPRLIHKYLVRVIQISSFLFTLISFLVPPLWVSCGLFTAFYPVFIITVFYGLYIVIMAIISGEEDAIPMAAGVLLLSASALFDMLVDRDILFPRFYYQMDKGMIGFIFFQAYIITLRINRAYENEKRFREALQGVQSRLEMTVDGAQLGLIEWDIAHNSWYLNDIFARMIGFRKDDNLFTRRHWLDLIHPNDREDINIFLKRAVSGKIGNFQKEYRLRLESGSYRWFLLMGRVIQQNRLGGAEWFVGLHIDVSDKKRREEALSQIIHADRSELERVRDEAEQILLSGEKGDV
ncbi:MAG: PAS domain-containing protein [Spirochaetales bacterium]|nr:PAS domain-containing protein [Spirochaetales bacterium]